MAISLTNATKRALNQTAICPNIVVEIEGISTLFSTVAVKDYVLYGDDNTLYGEEGLFYGGLKAVGNNKTYLDDKKTTSSIKQQMNYDEGNTSSISSMTLSFVDKNQDITKIISPGIEIPEILGRKVWVYLSFDSVSFFDDSIEIFKGFVERVDSNAGNIQLKINHPDSKKKVKLFEKSNCELTSLVNASQTSVPVNDTGLAKLQNGPLTPYIRIDKELIGYTGFTATSFTGLTRGDIQSDPLPHDDKSSVDLIYCLEGNPLELALQIMLSGHGTDPMYENVEVTSFNKVGLGTDQVQDAIYFDLVNIPQKYGVTVGDTVTISGATNGANNVTTVTITGIEKFKTGYYLLIDGAGLVLEPTTSAVMSTFSQWNVLEDGMKMRPDEVDIEEHLLLRDRFHSSVNFRIYLKEDQIEGKDFIEKQLYQPIACYALPRKARSSVGYTVGPIPGEELVTFNERNIIDPHTSLTLSRTRSRAFFNRVFYKYDDIPQEDGQYYTTGALFISQSSIDRIGKTSTMIIESWGLRTDLNAENIATSNANRILDRYKYGAEFVSGKVLFKDSLSVEIGDVIVADFKNLQVSDTSQGNRQFSPKLYEIRNIDKNLKTGAVSFVAMDTGQNIDARFGLLSPCSPIVGTISQSQFVIGPDPDYPSKHGLEEFRKWENVIDITNPIGVTIFNKERTISENAIVVSISENTFTLKDPLITPITTDLMIEFAPYDYEGTSDKQKLIYAYMTDDAAFPDGGFPYVMI